MTDDSCFKAKGRSPPKNRPADTGQKESANINPIGTAQIQIPLLHGFNLTPIRTSAVNLFQDRLFLFH